MHTLDKDRARFNPASAADHLRWRSPPCWAVRRLVRRHGLHAATAKTVAEFLGYALEDR
jgi:hypothetical protein